MDMDKCGDSLAFFMLSLMPFGLEPEAAVGTGDGGGLTLALLGDLPLTGTFEGCDVGHSLDGDPVGVGNVEADFLASALRSENQLVNANNAHDKPPMTVTAKTAAKSFTSNTPNICFLQFLLRLAIGA
ncbi:MAG: hypothetical protein ACOYB3_01615 [Azonexus sp.]